MATEVGFIGLGAMGLPMALNLLATGHHLTVWNRTESKTRPLAAKGAHVAERPEDVAQPGGVVISMLADDAALEHLVLGDTAFAHRLGKGGIHLSMSTVAPATTRKLAAYHAEFKSALVAAPVFGRPDAAAGRKLWMCVSGPAKAKERLQPIFDAIGQGVFDFGEEPGAANVAKLAGNFLIAAAMEAMGEAFAMVEKQGLDRAAVAEMLSSTIFACPVYRNYGLAIAERRHSPAGFRLPLGLKDIELVMSSAAEARVPMPLASILRDRFIAALAKGRDELDWSAIALGAREDAGLGENA
jgi:3-hydroxyisobutyrate dehydrogenase-like beta-hydroxyacid dehydrogenase